MPKLCIHLSEEKKEFVFKISECYNNCHERESRYSIVKQSFASLLPCGTNCY